MARVEFNMTGSIARQEFETDAEAMAVYEAAKAALETYSEYRNRQAETFTYEVSDGSKQTIRLASLTSVLFNDGGEPDWLVERVAKQLIFQNKIQQRAKKLLYGSAIPDAKGTD